MVSKLFGILGDSNEKQIKRLQWVVDETNALEGEFEALSDEALRSTVVELREQLDEDETLDDLLPEAFAAVREAARRSIGLRHFDVQLIGGAVLHEGKVAEMKTGEGKTLMATLAMFLNALPGEGAHLVTVNDYLARRDAGWMGPVYDALGMTVGCLQHQEAYIFDASAEEGQDGQHYHLRPATRREAYECDITYGTNNEFGFDFLRDNMVASEEQRVQRTLVYAIVDEVDNILIDEARTPLIISGATQESSNAYKTFAHVVPRLAYERDYVVDAKTRTVALTDDGITKLEGILKLENLYDPANGTVVHHIENALRAVAVYERDKEYVVQNGEVVIVDDFTGRLMEGRRFGDGLHQAIEAKEGVSVQQETVTYATITLQNYFRIYGKLSGMTGTAVTEGEEFHKVYKLEVVVIPTHRPMARKDLPDYIYKTEEAKYQAVAEAIAEMHEEGRPVLVGTVSIERSEHLSQMLTRRKVRHEVLNAKQHEREAHVVAQAGRPGAVTVATNMAGRGTDIVLGGDPSIAESPEEWQRDHDAVIAAGGLYILGTERHESRRIDNQLRGRSGRQGDPGSSRFFGSLEDEIMRRFGGERLKGIMNLVRLPDDIPLESRMITKVVDSTQSKVEAHNFDIRKNLVEYDDVVNTQRDIIYSERLKILSGIDLKTDVQEMVTREIQSVIGGLLQGESDDWETDVFLAAMGTIFSLPPGFDEDHILDQSAAETEEELLVYAENLYEEHEVALSPELMRNVERGVMVQTIDRLWVQHLTTMQNLRQGIGLYAYGQRDPLVMYKKEGFDRFQELQDRIRHDVARTIFHIVPPEHIRNGAGAKRPTKHAVQPAVAARPETVLTQAAVSARQPAPFGASHSGGMPKVGRNDSCPCGSGKKYKRCHGAH
jgi:preprotein translocase subunit SecA